ncbi:2-C-methyl-D-erythritol 4-phosphate cytidylyltransferase [Spiribacter vilamensis]|nr:2-C-methyl-D-erythritol 4-phosphate cytidylyltransferase [Spiribacter vilamensis]
MGSVRPKQYHAIAGRPVLAWSVDALLGIPAIAGVMIVRSADDTCLEAVMPRGDPRWRDCIGGGERQASVQAGLAALRDWGADATDRVLVHDAARPAVTQGDIRRLIDHVGDDPDGGLLAAPVRDTLKRADDEGRVASTPSRDGLWQAMTPQLFPLGRLESALAMASGAVVTDEAQAMERLGARPRLVAGDPGNIKYTYPDDARWLAWALDRQRAGDEA